MVASFSALYEFSVLAITSLELDLWQPENGELPEAWASFGKHQKFFEKFGRLKNFKSQIREILANNNKKDATPHSTQRT
jgi:hypothetical protein